VLTPVAVIVNVVPITVLETLVPFVEVELVFKAVAAAVLTPVAVKLLNNLTSEIVKVYPEGSKVLLPER